MPLKKCQKDGKPGFKWGDNGFCYTYTPDNDRAKKIAKKKAIKQGIAIDGKNFKDEVKSYAEERIQDVIDEGHDLFFRRKDD